MHTDIKIGCSRERSINDIIGYCYTCKELFCKECMVGHIGHETQKVKDFCINMKVSVHELATQIEEQSKKRIEIANMLKEIPMEYCLALYIVGRKEFFWEKACINCPVDKYCACDGADVLFDIDGVLRKELVEVGRGVRMTQPLKVEKGFLTGGHIHVSLSHKGVLAVCARKTVQFTDYRYIFLGFDEDTDARLIPRLVVSKQL